MVKHIIHNEESDEQVIEWQLDKSEDGLLLNAKSNDGSWITVLEITSDGEAFLWQGIVGVAGLNLTKDKLIRVIQ